MIKVSKSFVIFLLLVFCIGAFMPNNIVLGASENYLDVNTDNFSSIPNNNYLKNLDLNEIKTLLANYCDKNGITYTDNLPTYNTLLSHCTDSYAYIFLYRDDVFNLNKFYLGDINGSSQVIIDKNDITFPIRHFRIVYELNNDNNTGTRNIQFTAFPESSFDSNFKNGQYPFVSATTIYYTNFDVVDYKTGNLIQSASIGVEQDAQIGDSSSRLKLSYEYNEDYTECKINATLENGAFTDKIFYSNYMPSIAGQGLLSKQAFPRERYNFNRESVSFLSSGR